MVEATATIREVGEPLLGAQVVLEVGQGVPSLLNMPGSLGRDHRSCQGGVEMDTRLPRLPQLTEDPKRRNRLP